MTVYVKEKCRNCGASLTEWIPNYYTIEEPFIVCPSCRVANDRSGKANEWEFCTSGQKVAHILLSVYWGLGYGLVFALVIGSVWMQLNPELRDISVTSKESLLSLVGGLILGLLVSNFGLYRRIRRSRQRLLDSNYRSCLERYGHIPN